MNSIAPEQYNGLLILSKGDRIIPGNYRLHSVFSSAANYTGPERRFLRLVPEQYGEGPLNLAINSFSPESCPQAIEVKPGGPIYNSDPELSRQEAAQTLARAGQYGRALAQAAPRSFAALLGTPPRRESEETGGLERDALEGLGKLRAGRFADGARKLRALDRTAHLCGTDFLCGFLLGVSVLEKAHGKNLNNIKQTVFAAALGGSPPDNAFLECARDGRADSRMKNFIRALASSLPAQAAKTVAQAQPAGACGFADTAAGFIFALENKYGD